VRTPREYEAGHIEGAKNISHDQIKSRMAELGTDKDRAIVLYCRSGRRTGIAAGILADAGFTNVLDAKRYDRMKAEWERRKQ
jgi:phage shock protein E